MLTQYKLTRCCCAVLLLLAELGCTDSAAPGSDGGDGTGASRDDAAVNDPRSGGKKPTRDAGGTSSTERDAGANADADAKVDAATDTAECSASKPCPSPADLGECKTPSCVDATCGIENAASGTACTAGRRY